jgi:hypothetical protein
MNLINSETYLKEERTFGYLTLDACGYLVVSRAVNCVYPNIGAQDQLATVPQCVKHIMDTDR